MPAKRTRKTYVGRVYLGNAAVSGSAGSRPRRRGMMRSPPPASSYSAEDPLMS
jgi:hypothetical protein